MNLVKGVCPVCGRGIHAHYGPPRSIEPVAKQQEPMSDLVGFHQPAVEEPLSTRVLWAVRMGSRRSAEIANVLGCAIKSVSNSARTLRRDGKLGVNDDGYFIIKEVA